MADPQVVAVIQARMSSRRFPGKVLAPLNGRPMLCWMVDRVRNAHMVDRVVIATSRHPTDDVIAGVCCEADIDFVRGPLDDVLARFCLVVDEEWAVVVRLTADCPFVAPGIIDTHVSFFLRHESPVDYVSNVLTRTYPDGLDVEVVARAALLEANDQAIDAYDREHVTPWIQRHRVIAHITQAADLSALRWTVDTPDDLRFVEQIYDGLPAERAKFTSTSIYKFILDHPQVLRSTPGVSEAVLIDRIRQHLAVVNS